MSLKQSLHKKKSGCDGDNEDDDDDEEKNEDFSDDKKNRNEAGCRPRISKTKARGVSHVQYYPKPQSEMSCYHHPKRKGMLMTRKMTTMMMAKPALIHIHLLKP